MIVHRIKLYNSEIFAGYWITQPPSFKPDFIAWMTETFGHRWYSNPCDFTRVRSSSGAGNRGGWESKPHAMDFYFDSDADGLVFKMRFAHLISESSEVEPE